MTTIHCKCLANTLMRRQQSPKRRIHIFSNEANRAMAKTRHVRLFVETIIIRFFIKDAWFSIVTAMLNRTRLSLLNTKPPDAGLDGKMLSNNWLISKMAFKMSYFDVTHVVTSEHCCRDHGGFDVSLLSFSACQIPTGFDASIWDVALTFPNRKGLDVTS